MIGILIAVIVFSLFLIFCFRHFFIQLVGLKLFLDGAVVFLVCAKNPEAPSSLASAAATLISAISVLVFFILMAAGIQRFARSKTSSLEVRSD